MPPEADGTRFAFIYRTGDLTGAVTTEVPGEVGNCALSLDGTGLARHDNLTLETVAACRSDVITLGLSIGVNEIDRHRDLSLRYQWLRAVRGRIGDRHPQRASLGDRLELAWWRRFETGLGRPATIPGG